MDKTIDIDETEECCPICLCPLVKDPWTRICPCGHGSHTACAVGWFLRNPEHLHVLVDAGASSSAINEEDATCPMCRRRWEPQGAPVAVAPPPLGGTMEVTNHAMLVAHTESVRAAAAAAAAAEANMDEAEEGEVPDSPSARGISQSVDKCNLCDQVLFGMVWTELQPCGCCVHLTCFHDKLLDENHPDYLSFRTLDLFHLRCPLCGGSPLDGPDLFDDYLNKYPLRPVAPDHYAAPQLHMDEAGVVTSWWVPHGCLWVALVDRLTLCRDQDLQQLLAFDFLAPDDAYAMYKNQGKDLLELMQICYICRLPLACNYWVDVESCNHVFHLRCLCNLVFGEVDEVGGFAMVCPVCRLVIVLVGGSSNLPDNFLWCPMSSLCYEPRSLFELRPRAFWWEVDRQRHVLDTMAAQPQILQP